MLPAASRSSMRRRSSLLDTAFLVRSGVTVVQAPHRDVHVTRRGPQFEVRCSTAHLTAELRTDRPVVPREAGRMAGGVTDGDGGVDGDVGAVVERYLDVAG